MFSCTGEVGNRTTRGGALSHRLTDDVSVFLADEKQVL